MLALKPWHRALLMAAFVGITTYMLVWITLHDSAVNFLPSDRKADWIVFPDAVSPRVHWFASLDATFKREFILTHRPRTARLAVRAMRSAEVKVNGNPVDFPPSTNWKESTSIDVAEQLQAGTNVIEARVFNHNGPPAFWLTLNTD
jgi:hypothetical protein